MLAAAFVPVAQPAVQAGVAANVQASQRFLAQAPQVAPAPAGLGVAGALVGAAVGVAAVGAAKSRRSARKAVKARSTALVGASIPAPQAYVRDELVACRAQLSEAGVDGVEEIDNHVEELIKAAKQAAAGTAAAVVFMSGMADSAEAYPIFAQQNYKEPRAANGKLACANCHLASKPIDVRVPHEILPDTIFKASIEIPLKYAKREQPIADGSKAKLNIGAIAIMPDGFRLAPKDRLPKDLKKQMKGLAWAPYSKEKPNVVVAGPVPGNLYEKMTLPILAPKVDEKNIYFDKVVMFVGGNRGRGQVYPEGNQSNNNQFFASSTGTVSAIDGLKVSITGDDGTKTQELLPGATIVVSVGDKVKKDDPITTNPNVGGFGQGEYEFVLQDMNRVYAYCAVSVSIFFAQLAFVLKKKQFEKVQLAEGF